jgi:hypothetical protein
MNEDQVLDSEPRSISQTNMNMNVREGDEEGESDTDERDKAGAAAAESLKPASSSSAPPGLKRGAVSARTIRKKEKKPTKEKKVKEPKPKGRRQSSKETIVEVARDESESSFLSSSSAHSSDADEMMSVRELWINPGFNSMDLANDSSFSLRGVWSQSSMMSLVMGQ